MRNSKREIRDFMNTKFNIRRKSHSAYSEKRIVRMTERFVVFVGRIYIKRIQSVHRWGSPEEDRKMGRAK